MIKKLINRFVRPESDLIDSDEVLLALKYKSAYRSFMFIVTSIIFTALVFLIIGVEGEWIVVGKTLAVVFFSMILVYEVLLAYEGVFKGQDELFARLKLSRSVVVRKALLNGTLTGIYIFVVFLFTSKDSGIPWLAAQSVVVAAVSAWITYSRYRKSIR